jgi:hypothetical protein
MIPVCGFAGQQGGGMTKQAPDDIAAAIGAASALLASRYPGADCAFVAGSIMRGEGTKLSDIDLVVIFSHVKNAWRESLLFDGFPVEAFVHDPETLRWFIAEDVEGGAPIMPSMVAEGRLIGPRIAAGTPLQIEASATLAKGPPPLSGERLNTLRYQLTDRLDDLHGKRTAAEIQAIGAALYQPLANLILLGRGRWTGNGKWIPRLLQRLSPTLANQFDAAFQNLFAEGDTATLIVLAQDELDRLGGRLFEGDRRDAPATARHVPGSKDTPLHG